MRPEQIIELTQTREGQIKVIAWRDKMHEQIQAQKDVFWAEKKKYEEMERTLQEGMDAFHLGVYGESK